MAHATSRRLLPAVVVLAAVVLGGDEPQKGQASGAAPRPGSQAAAAPAKKSGEKKKVEVAIVFLTEMNIVQLTVDVNPLVNWVRPAIAAVEKRFEGDAARRIVVIQATLHRDRPAEVGISGQPALSDAEAKDLRRVLDPANAPRTKVVDCTFRVVAQINGGPAGIAGPTDPKIRLVPPLETPDERRLAAFRAAKTAEKLAMIRRWARNEALPILGATANVADAKFEGVRALGRTIQEFSSPEVTPRFDIPSLTDHNPAYWRAMVEMAPGEPMVPMVRIVLQAANGEIDRARRYVNVTSFFDANKSAPSRLLGDFREMMRLFYKDVESRISEGIALNDKGKLDEAMAVYEGVLRDYPGSAWARYEQVQTRMAMARKEGKPVEDALADWPAARDAILGADPLYEMLAQAQGPEETYRLVLRMQIRTLFKDRKRTVQDVIRYADIAQDLGDFGFAAFIYWNMIGRVKEEQFNPRDLIDRFLFCLDELGVKTIQENFKGDHAATFARMREERRKRIEAGPGKTAKDRPAGDRPPKPASDRPVKKPS
ncbi:MAG: tetratricopeptide repeat protein [Isosphaeraceae bacterium]